MSWVNLYPDATEGKPERDARARMVSPGEEYARLVGRVAQVYWPSASSWYTGRVLRHDGDGRVSVLYASGDVEHPSNRPLVGAEDVLRLRMRRREEGLGGAETTPLPRETASFSAAPVITHNASWSTRRRRLDSRHESTTRPRRFASEIRVRSKRLRPLPSWRWWRSDREAADDLARVHLPRASA